MPDNKKDRRVRKTKKVLVNSLLTLLKEKKINAITVTELTDLADVNRSTFYFYYKDVYDMMEQIEDDVLQEFTKAMEEFSGNSHEDLVNFFVFIFEFIGKNADMCKILLGPEADNTFLTRLKEIINEYQPTTINTYCAKLGKYWMPFTISGCIGTIQQWLDDDMSVPPREIAEFIINVMAKGVIVFSSTNNQ
jgi:AcrR family transcriptional regulator